MNFSFVLVARARRALWMNLALGAVISTASGLISQTGYAQSKADTAKAASVELQGNSAQGNENQTKEIQAKLKAAYPALRDLNAHCPFTPPESLAVWEPRAAELREQLLVSLGLWPMPKLEPVQPKVYGKIDLDGYSIEKVTFETLPGFYVTGNLYRPNPMPQGKKIPAVLCPHGHWDNARFYDCRPQEIKTLLATGAERFENAARNHLQAKCVQLARMGCVAFHWDMIGYCDSTQISYDRAHRFAKQDSATEVTDAGWLLFSPLAESHAQSIMGLQTLTGIRSVDFVLTLPEVDPARIGITGASGGGTQSFITAAVDPRIQVAFPAVMVSTGMQGGCTCENTSGTRTGTNNVELAALIAPRALGMTAANDWTKTMPEDGYPELQKLYSLFKAKDKVGLFPAIHFGHNYNHVARVSMYGWMNKHFGLGLSEPVLERDFEWKGREDLHVWDADHPQPEGGIEFERKLLKGFRDNIDSQWKSKLSSNSYDDYLKAMKTGWRVVLELTSGKLEQPKADSQGANSWVLNSSSDGTWLISEAGRSDSSLSITSTDAEGKNVKKYALTLVGQGRDATGALVTLEEQPLVNNPRLAAAYTYCYNRPMFARQARQVAATIMWLRSQQPGRVITIEGSDQGAAIAAAAAFDLNQIAPEASQSLKLKLRPNGFRFAKAKSIQDPNMLPGSARFLDLPGLVSCLNQSIEVAGDDTGDFSNYAKVVAGQGGSLTLGPKS